MICFKKTILIEIEILIDFDDIKIGKCYIHTNKIIGEQEKKFISLAFVSFQELFKHEQYLFDVQ